MGSGMSLSPPLGGTTTLALPPTLPDDALVDCTFSARFESQHARALARREHARLELWSDLPADGRPAGSWGALPFAWASASSSSPDSTPSSAPPAGLATLALAPVPAPDASDKADDADDEPLVLRFSARFPTPAWGGPLRFAYTYRLVYPDGGVRWLGAFGHDGALLVERRDARIQLAAPQGQAWTRAPGGGEYRWETGRKVEVEVGKLDTALGWAVWAVGQDGQTTFYPTLAALPPTLTPSLLVLLPTTPKHALTPLQPLLLRTRSLTALSLLPTGEIKIAYAGTPPPALLSLRSYDPSWDLRAFAEDVFRGAQGNVRLVGAVPQSGCVVLASPKGVQPVTLSVIPLALGAPAPPAALLSLRDLAALLPQIGGQLGSGGCALFAPASGAALSFEAQQTGDEPVFVSCGPRGGQAVLARAHALEEEGVRVAVLTPHELAPAPEPEPESEPEVAPVAVEETLKETLKEEEAAEEAQEVVLPPAPASPVDPAPPTPTTPTSALAPIPEPASDTTPTTTPTPSSPRADTPTSAAAPDEKKAEEEAPTTPKRSARPHLPSPPPTPGRMRSPAQSVSEGAVPAGYFPGFGSSLAGLEGRLRRRTASVLSQASSSGAVEEVPQETTTEDAQEEEAQAAPATDDAPELAPASPRAAASGTTTPPRMLINAAQSAGTLLRTHGARACVRLYVAHLLRLSALLVAMVFARALGTLGFRRGLVQAGLPEVALGREERSTAVGSVEQEVMVIDEEEEVPVPAAAAEPTKEEEPVVVPAVVSEAPAPEEDASEEDAASTASSTVAGSPKLVLDDAAGAADADLPPVASDLDLPPPAHVTPEPAAVEAKQPQQPQPKALRFAVPAGDVALLVSAGVQAKPAAALLDALRLELGGERVVPALSALGHGVVLRLRAEAAGVLSVLAA